MDLYFSKRSVGVSILLSIVTCGIYSLVWLYQLLTTLYRENNQPNSAAVDIVLFIITCSLYGYYLMYKMGKMESAIHYKYGMPPKDDSVLYLILGIFQLWIIVYAILQSNINSLADEIHRRGGPGGPGPYGGHNPYGGGYGQDQGQGPRMQ